MEEFLELLNMPSWSDIGGLRTHLEVNPPGTAELGTVLTFPVEAGSESSAGDSAGHKQGSETFPAADGQPIAGGGGLMDFRQDHESGSTFALMNSLQGNSHSQSGQFLQFQMENGGVQQLGGTGGGGNVMIGSQGGTSAGFPPTIHTSEMNPLMSSSSFVPVTSVWRQQPYIGDLQQQLLKPDMFMNSSNPLFTTRYRSGSIPNNLRMHRDGARGVLNAYGLGQQKPPLQSSSRGSYRNTQPAPATPMSGAQRPRVRARRGQATDPHSIAERQRRERIADRMKELQGLVPNANKTDKAIMLDEIIEYVKFLQLQSKIFTMCRMGSPGSVPCLLPPSEYSCAMAASLSQSNGATPENIANLERQVAKLMDESMGSALQFIQSKGFCLMPVSMAAALSATKSVHQPIFSGDKTETSTIVTERPGGMN